MTRRALIKPNQTRMGAADNMTTDQIIIGTIIASVFFTLVALNIGLAVYLCSQERERRREREASDNSSDRYERLSKLIGVNSESLEDLMVVEYRRERTASFVYEDLDNETDVITFRTNSSLPWSGDTRRKSRPKDATEENMCSENKIATDPPERGKHKIVQWSHGSTISKTTSDLRINHLDKEETVVKSFNQSIFNNESHSLPDVRSKSVEPNQNYLLDSQKHNGMIIQKFPIRLVTSQGKNCDNSSMVSDSVNECHTWTTNNVLKTQVAPFELKQLHPNANTTLFESEAKKMAVKSTSDEVPTSSWTTSLSPEKFSTDTAQINATHNTTKESDGKLSDPKVNNITDMSNKTIDFFNNTVNQRAEIGLDGSDRSLPATAKQGNNCVGDKKQGADGNDEGKSGRRYIKRKDSKKRCRVKKESQPQGLDLSKTTTDTIMEEEEQDAEIIITGNKESRTANVEYNYINLDIMHDNNITNVNGINDYKDTGICDAEKHDQNFDMRLEISPSLIVTTVICSDKIHKEPTPSVNGAQNSTFVEDVYLHDEKQEKCDSDKNLVKIRDSEECPNAVNLSIDSQEFRTQTHPLPSSVFNMNEETVGQQDLHSPTDGVPSQTLNSSDEDLRAPIKIQDQTKDSWRTSKISSRPTVTHYHSSITKDEQAIINFQQRVDQEQTSIAAHGDKRIELQNTPTHSEDNQTKIVKNWSASGHKSLQPSVDTQRHKTETNGNWKGDNNDINCRQSEVDKIYEISISPQTPQGRIDYNVRSHAKKYAQFSPYLIPSSNFLLSDEDLEMYTDDTIPTIDDLVKNGTVRRKKPGRGAKNRHNVLALPDPLATEADSVSTFTLSDFDFGESDVDDIDVGDDREGEDVDSLREMVIGGDINNDDRIEGNFDDSRSRNIRDIQL